ncbi:MAG: metallophosphoesterase [Methanocorpusculum sp.]|uniref:metallophosphoesterase family protein n=1 Tax=Methanocorpusculum sp. TaxID=2058474 RepID=UPI0027230EDD|nr:metallophosphoesterase [Methanocorpusculum sp.]MDO9522614.1 metallophosphoesterase [Methanocorpusculum sp.]
MTEIVFITDIHGKFDIVYEIFNRESPDYVLIGGDVTDLGETLDGVIPFMEDIPAPTFVIPGNCDSRDILPVLEASDAIPIHRKSIDLGMITISGIGGSNATPFSTPFEHSEEDLEAITKEVVAKTGKNRWNILVTHAPPFGALDEVAPDVHVGAFPIAKIVKEFDIICCGHIHEQRGICELERRICVNPGPAYAGNYAVITLDEDEDEPKIVLKNTRDPIEVTEE